MQLSNLWPLSGYSSSIFRDSFPVTPELPIPDKNIPISHHQLCVWSVRQRVHQAGACLWQTRQSLAPVGSLGEETLLHALLLSLHLLQETLLLLLQGFTCCADLSQYLLPRPARRCLGRETGEKKTFSTICGVGGEICFESQVNCNFYVSKAHTLMFPNFEKPSWSDML